MFFRWDKKRGLLDGSGKQILQVVATKCSAKFRNEAGAMLAAALNGQTSRGARATKSAKAARAIPPLYRPVDDDGRFGYVDLDTE